MFVPSVRPLLLALAIFQLHALPASGFVSSVDYASDSVKSVNLNEFVVNGNGIKSFRKKSRVSDVSLGFCIRTEENPPHWDSSYFLTRFPPPTDQKFLLVSVNGRLADFDTSKFQLFLTVMQMTDGDTLFKQLPIELGPGERPKNAYSMDIREAGVILKPAPYYLGYGLQVKPMTESYLYRLYSTWGGEGAWMRIRKGQWQIHTDTDLPYIFPFTISYLPL